MRTRSALRFTRPSGVLGLFGRVLNYLVGNSYNLYSVTYSLYSTSDNAGVVVGGTPGIGKSAFLRAVSPRGEKGSSLSEGHKGLAPHAGRHLVGGNPLFGNESWNQPQHWDAICLIDSDAAYTPPPPMLTRDRILFIVQAASPNPQHTMWRGQRPNVFQFILNPLRPEIVAALQIHDRSPGEFEITTAVAKYGFHTRTLHQILRMNDEESIRREISNKSTHTDSQKLNTILAAILILSTHLT